MSLVYRDEFRWDPDLNEDRVPEELLNAPEYPALSCEEISAPAAEWQAPPEYEQETTLSAREADRSREKRREAVKKLFAVPVAASVAVASIVFAAFGQDPLKNDVLAGALSLIGVSSAKTAVPLPALDGEVTYYYHVTYAPTGASYDASLKNDDGLADVKAWVTKQGGDPATMLRYRCDVTPTGRKPSEGAVYVGDVDDFDNLYFVSGSLVDTYTVDVYYEAYAKSGGETDPFPKLGNLDPDFAGKYAWSGQGSEEYVVVSADGVNNSFLHAGTYYTASGVKAGGVSGASYDRSTNTLTLTDYHGAFVDVNLMGNGFTVKLVGDNTLDYLSVWGAMYGGSVTFTGDGSLTLNKSGKAASGLLLNCEYSASCLMIDSGVTLEIYGQPALFIGDSLMEETIFVREPVRMSGGTVTVEKAGTNEDGDPCYTVNVTDPSGQPATHVTFKPAS